MFAACQADMNVSGGGRISVPGASRLSGLVPDLPSDVVNPRSIGKRSDHDR